MKGKIKAIVDDYAASIIKAVMGEYKIGTVDFHKAQFIHCIKARAVAIKRLHADGFEIKEISRVMQVDRGTVAYRLNPEFRKRKRAREDRRRSRIAAERASA